MLKTACRYSLERLTTEPVEDAIVMGCTGHHTRHPRDPELTPSNYHLHYHSNGISISIHVCSFGCALEIIKERGDSCKII